MTTPDDVLASIGTRTADGTRVTSEDLENLWARLMPNSYASRQGLNAFLDGVQGATRRSDSQLDFRPGGWEVNLNRGISQSVIAGALIGGLLVTLGATQIPAALVTAVVPLFFDVSRVRLEPGEEYLLAELVAHQESLDGTLTPDELYLRLDPDTRQGLSKVDFINFLDVCRRAGLADPGPDGTVELRPLGKARFRITYS
jgi:hypothetical protein